MDLNLVLELALEDIPESILNRHEGCVAKYLIDEASSDATVLLIDIEADYTPYCPGRYAGHPDNMYPAEEADVEVLGHVISFVYPLELKEVSPMDEEAFMRDLLQYGRDWLEDQMPVIREQLMDKGKNQHGDEISYILAQVEEDMECRRERIEDDFRDGAGIEDKVRGAVADWVSRRTSAPDEK